MGTTFMLHISSPKKIVEWENARIVQFNGEIMELKPCNSNGTDQLLVSMANSVQTELAELNPKNKKLIDVVFYFATRWQQ